MATDDCPDDRTVIERILFGFWPSVLVGVTGLAAVVLACLTWW